MTRHFLHRTMTAAVDSCTCNFDESTCRAHPNVCACGAVDEEHDFFWCNACDESHPVCSGTIFKKWLAPGCARYVYYGDSDEPTIMCQEALERVILDPRYIVRARDENMHNNEYVVLEDADEAAAFSEDERREFIAWSDSLGRSRRSDQRKEEALKNWFA